MRELEYPFDSGYILKKKKRLRRELLEQKPDLLKKKIAVLGGSTTTDVIQVLDLFLLEQGICAEFYESEYALYWEDAVFGNPALEEFRPDLIYIHTTVRNITQYPDVGATKDNVQQMLSSVYRHFEEMWEKLDGKYHCPIIQNNLELPFFRLFGNRDAWDHRGRVRFVQCLNEMFYQYADAHENFYIQDIQYLSACFGLDEWADDFYWHMYKYAMAVPAIPDLAFNLSNIIKSIYGKNKKAIVLDLDNTLWGGVVGDDGVEQLEIGQETSNGQAFWAFQSYLKERASLGIMLNVDSKNEYENAIAGLEHPEGVLRPDDLIIIKANWEPKSSNIMAIASELNIMPDSLVFVDDNPSEREIVRRLDKGIAVPEVSTPDHYIQVLDRSGFFEITDLSEDDIKRNAMYRSNIQREQLEASYMDYHEYLISLEMRAVIREFEGLYMARIAQLTNKSNQFNLTTRRYSQAEIEQIAADDAYVTLYGKLEDRFGDNGVVSVIIGHVQDKICHIDLWIMSCRVLKRDMECAMFDALADRCIKRGVQEMRGYYLPTAKNKMVKDFYGERGFEKTIEDPDGSTQWRYRIPDDYQEQNRSIKIISG